MLDRNVIAELQLAVRKHGLDLQAYKELGAINVKQSKDDPELLLFNYSKDCKEFNEFERVCRGLIINHKTLEIVARPFDKFFNIGEKEETFLDNLPWMQPYHVLEKLDGSLGILYRTKDGYKITTKGSFESEQGKWATKYFNNSFYQDRLVKPFSDDITLLFEIIYPENQENLVLKYDKKERLVLIGIRDRYTGYDFDQDSVRYMANHLHMEYAITYPVKYIRDLQELAEKIEGIEGYVIRFDHSGLRVKLKTNWYKSISKAMMHLDEKGVIDVLIEDRWDSYYRDLPEEIQKDADDLRLAIEIKLHSILTDIKSVWEFLDNVKHDRTLFAKTVTNSYYKHLAKYLFAKLDGKDVNKMILKELRKVV